MRKDIINAKPYTVINILRKKYGDKITKVSENEDCQPGLCCVGGAFWVEMENLSLENSDAFPSPNSLAESIKQYLEANYDDPLCDISLRPIARRITYKNDSGLFQEAWEILESALNNRMPPVV